MSLDETEAFLAIDCARDFLRDLLADSGALGAEMRERAVQTYRMLEEIDTETGEELSEHDEYLNEADRLYDMVRDERL